MVYIPRRLLLLLVLLLSEGLLPAADTFRVATYNVENYLEQPSGTRPAKSDAAKAKVRESILALKPDVLALEEMGTTNALLELQGSLKTAGLQLPYWELVTGADTNIHVAVLSRFPITARQPLTNDSFLLNGRRFRVSRGFAQVDILVNPRLTFTLIAVHLKSKLAVPEADEADLRLEEAKLLREKIDARLAASPNLNLIVLGDFNDYRDSPSLKTILGRGKRGLVDTRPAERNGDREPPADRHAGSREVTWTQFFAQEDLYSRMDYILLSHNMADRLVPAGTYVLALPNWGVGSDHRPLVATFVARD
jgi:endonuclease/exonuclease/phosphatase family metal-dependent hydrolase